jgi:DNA-binding transcriptional LysR family regulator
MELRELRVLVAIADHGGVSRAARVLHLSPSAVSHALASLESQLGVSLFVRLARGMALTEAGRAVLGPARRALQEAEAVEAAAAAVEGLVTGRLTIVPSRVFVHPIVDLVERFHAEHPLVVISLREPEGDHLIAGIVRSGECECGVMRTDLVPPDLRHTSIGCQTGAVVVPADHELAGKGSVRVSDLSGLPMIAPPPTSPFRPYFDGVLASEGVEPRIVAESNHLETTVALVRRGIGVTLASVESAGPSVGDGAVVLPLVPETIRPMSLVARGGTPLAPVTEAFWEVAQRIHGSDGRPAPAP